MTLLTAFTGNPLDRDDRYRQDKTLLDAAFTDPAAQFLVILKGKVLTNGDGSIHWVNASGLIKDCIDFHIFLGLDGDKKCFAVQVNGGVEEDPDTGLKLRDARTIGMKLGPGSPELGIVAQAKSVLDWHHRHRFCANCGTPTEIEKVGYQRTCPNCGHHHFPRTDPVVIMLVECGDKILLGRGPKLPPGFFSALAGFVEPGESLEEAVVRELKEEAGVTASNVQYLASQPWPWPSSLMMGCIAQTDSFDLEPDGDEIDELTWLTRDELKEIVAGKNPKIAVPPPIAIARTLIDHWIATKS